MNQNDKFFGRTLLEYMISFLVKGLLVSQDAKYSENMISTICTIILIVSWFVMRKKLFCALYFYLLL